MAFYFSNLILQTANIKERQDFLKNQLNIFEDNFAKYISNQVSINKNFRSNAKNKLSFILNSQKITTKTLL